MKELNLTSNDLFKELEAIEKNRDSHKKDYDSLKEKRYAEIKVIEDKYEPEMTQFNEKLFQLNEKIESIRKRANELVVEEEWQEAYSRGEINEFYIQALLNVMGIGMNEKDIKFKQTTKNNIDVWMVDSDAYYSKFKLYLAFYGDKLVGTSYRDTPAHAGDSTEPFSFIGQFDDPLTVGKYNEVREKTYYEKATFQQWMRKLKEINPDEIDLMSMNKETIEELKDGVNEYWDYYGWERKLKTQENG